MNRRITARIAAGLLAALTLAGCGSGGSAGEAPASSASNASAAASTPTSTASQELGIAVFLSVSANSYEQAQADGVKAAAQELGVGPVKVFDGGFDSTKQVGQIQDATTSGRFKAFVIEPIDGSAVLAPLKAATEKGIQVVCITTACGPDPTKIDLQFEGQAGVVASSYPKVAEQLAQRAIDACSGITDCKVFYANGDSTFTSDRAAKDSFAAAMKAAPATVKYVGSQDGKYDTATGRTIAQAELQREPDLDVIVSFADQQTLGIAQALDAAGKAGKVKLISFGGSSKAVTEVQSGAWLGTLVTLPRSIGEAAAEIAIAKAQGATPPAAVIDAGTLSTLEGGFLTKDNAAGFTAQWSS